MQFTEDRKQHQVTFYIFIKKTVRGLFGQEEEEGGYFKCRLVIGSKTATGIAEKPLLHYDLSIRSNLLR